jgi:hypothetical protein
MKRQSLRHIAVRLNVTRWWQRIGPSFEARCPQLLVNPATTTGRPRTKQRCQLTLLESVGFKTHFSIHGDHSECARR